jgi:hypothetical protein
LLLLLISPHRVFARDLYVAPTGNDANAGTIDQPLATFQGARDTIRTLRIAGKEVINVFFRGGTYEVANSVQFGPQDSGSANFPITYQGYQNENVIFSGGRVLTGWHAATANGKSVWQTTIPTGLPIPRQLFLNDVRETRAQGGGMSEGTKFTTSGFTIKTPLGYMHPEDIEMISPQNFLEFRCGINSATATSIVMNQPCWTTTRKGEFAFGWPPLLENSISLLDQPGEWFADPRTRLISYIPKVGETITGSRFVIPVLENIVAFRGISGNPVHHINLKNLKFMYDTWFRADTDGVYSFGAVEVWGTIRGYYSDNLIFDNLVISHTGTTGINLQNLSNSITISNSKISDTSGSGISILTYSGTNNGINILNNTITNIGNEYHGAFGIRISNSENVRVEHNTLDNLPYSGINFSCASATSTMLCLNNYIGSNLIKNTNTHLPDGGGIYTGNPIKDMVIEKNYITGIKGSYYSLYLDDNSMYKIVKSNVVFGNQNGVIVRGGGNTIINNFVQSLKTEVGLKGCKLNNVVIDCPWNITTNNIGITSLTPAALAIVNNAGVQASQPPPTTSPTSTPILTITPIPTPSSIPGDLTDYEDKTGDQVNIWDYNILMQDFGKKGAPGFLPDDITGDNGVPNGEIDIFDYNALLANFGK